MSLITTGSLGIRSGDEIPSEPPRPLTSASRPPMLTKVVIRFCRQNYCQCGGEGGVRPVAGTSPGDGGRHPAGTSPRAGMTDDVAVLDALRTTILDGEFAAGQRLVEVDLCERFGASRF